MGEIYYQFILRRLTEETNGDYTVATDESHYRDSLMAQCTPPPTQPGQGTMFADLVRMGFPAETQVKCYHYYCILPLSVVEVTTKFYKDT